LDDAYFVLESGAGSWVVSREMAAFVERELDREPAPQWVRFVDVTGARVRLRTDLIRDLRQSSAEIRALWRRFMQDRRKEAGDDDDESWSWLIDW
jgi:hypothetical protein